MSQQPLFHPRTLAKALQTANLLKDGQIPPKPLKALRGWQRAIQDGSINRQSEGNLHANFYSSLCETVLGYTSFTNKHQKTGRWTLANESAVKHTGRVDIGFGYFSDKEKQLLAPLELKSPKTSNMDVPMLGRKHSTVEQAAGYARNSQGQAGWFIVSNCIEIRLYRYPYSDAFYQSWQLAELVEPDRYAEFVLLLGAKSLLSGTTEKLFQNSQQVERQITNQLYADYRDIRVKLINGMKRENNRIRRAGMVARTQTLLDRVLFIAYAEDRDLLPDKTLNNYISAASEFHSAWDMLKLLFTHINDGNVAKEIPKYNGDLFKPNPDLEELSISAGLLWELKRLWEYDFQTDVSVTILGHIFEQSIADLDQIYESLDENNELLLAQQQQGTSGKRKQDGVVYTPDFITRWMVGQTLGAYLDKKKQEIQQPVDTAEWWLAYRNILATTRILDPACGSGAFLVAAFGYLKQEYAGLNERLHDLGEKGDLFGVDLNHDILSSNLFGVDINAESVEIARLSLWLVTAEKGKPLTSLKDNIRQGNSIIADKSVDKGAFSWYGRFSDFDVILGNPPYVRQERLSPIKPYLEANYKTYHGVADLYTYFFELGLNLLKKGGYMGFISSATFFKTGSGENLRQFLQVESNLKTVVNFGDLQVFEGVTTYPAILVMEKPTRVRKQAPNQGFRFLNVTSSKVADLSGELQETVFGEMQQSKLGLDGWRLEDERLQALRAKIIRNKPTLKEVYGQPLYGLKTGLNAAFAIDETTRNHIIKQNPQSLERLKPFLEGKDLKKWRAESRNLYLILFPKGWTLEQMGKSGGDVSESEAWRWLQSKHPAICEWLEPFTVQGRKRGDKGDFWWELRACAYYGEFEHQRVIYPEFSSSPNFILDCGTFTNNKCFFVPRGDSFLLGLLNSNTLWFVISGICTFVRGGFYELRTIRMETIPMPRATDPQKQTIAELAEACQTIAESRYRLEDTFTRRIADLCPNDREAKLSNKLKAWWELDFSGFQQEVKARFKQAIPLKERSAWEELFNEGKAQIQNLSHQLVTQEAALNQAVYELFGLDADEVMLLEQSLK